MEDLGSADDHVQQVLKSLRVPANVTVTVHGSAEPTLISRSGEARLTAGFYGDNKR
jgi:hypothetical protein